MLHESAVHAVPGRNLEDLGDSILLLDPVDPEPFWNRLAAIRWPSDPEAFDRRLTETAIRFANAARQAHLWVSPPHDEPADLTDRLLANGFESTGEGLLMVTADPEPAQAIVARGPGHGVAVHRYQRLREEPARAAAAAIVGVLLETFGVDDGRRSSIEAETMASLADPRFMHYLATVDGVPAAVARRATFDGLTYLSSIGTLPWARGRGLARTVTAMATAEGLASGSAWVHLGVFADNDPAIALYHALGFRRSGAPGPDMLLVGR
jgi:ribosomal protein S18 acetylase RimI-like enzyme